MTGATSGIGFELAKILYSAGATLYIASRSAEKLRHAQQRIKAEVTISDGTLHVLKLDLADLATIKRSAQEFLSKEQFLHVLVHNAGVMDPPAGSKTNLVSSRRI